MILSKLGSMSRRLLEVRWILPAVRVVEDRGAALPFSGCFLILG